ncbi:hypothetical protein, conserved, partial [Eimeria tenella]
MAFINRMALGHTCPLWIEDQVKEASRQQARKQQQQQQQQQQQDLITSILELNFGPRAAALLEQPQIPDLVASGTLNVNSSNSSSSSNSSNSSASAWPAEAQQLLLETAELEAAVLQQLRNLFLLFGGAFEPLFPQSDPTDIFQVAAAAAASPQQQQQQQRQAAAQHQLLADMAQGHQHHHQQQQQQKQQQQQQQQGCGGDTGGLSVRSLARGLKAIDDLVRQWLSLPSSDTSAVYSAVQQQLLQLLTQQPSDLAAAAAAGSAPHCSSSSSSADAEREGELEDDLLQQQQQQQRGYMQRMSPALCLGCTAFEDTSGSCAADGELGPTAGAAAAAAAAAAGPH